jgi:hypothetical protein
MGTCGVALGAGAAVGIKIEGVEVVVEVDSSPQARLVINEKITRAKDVRLTRFLFTDG